MEQLYDVVDYFSLGLFLHIPFSKIQIIESDFPVAQVGRTQKLLSHILVEWMRNHQEEATWSTLVDALPKINMTSTARRIVCKYGMCTYNVVLTLIHVPNTIDIAPGFGQNLLL